MIFACNFETKGGNSVLFVSIPHKSAMDIPKIAILTLYNQ